FFFQAEDCIRDFHVTGVQTCALPIYNGKLSKTSATPGKTQLINHFLINDNWYLVDLPGYGYAKTSKKNRLKWQGFISEYLLYRKNLMNVFVLIDSRLPPQTIDLDFMEWLGEKQIPFADRKSVV